MNLNRKFRVWDNQCKRYGLPPYIRRSREDVYIYDVETPQENPDLLQHHFVPEQCTGLKDRNGRLIFEGDVLEVGFGARHAYVQWSPNTCSFVLRRFDVNGWQISLSQDTASRYTIIGNIHEMESEVEE